MKKDNKQNWEDEFIDKFGKDINRDALCPLEDFIRQLLAQEEEKWAKKKKRHRIYVKNTDGRDGYHTKLVRIKGWKIVDTQMGKTAIPIKGTIKDKYHCPCYYEPNGKCCNCGKINPLKITK